MTIIPAIDLKNGKCVRLRQGLAHEETVYSDSPVAMAQHWVNEGGKFLHVVDLDGAFAGKPVHVEALRQICAAIAIPVEIGGGIRTDDDVERLLATGVTRVILGTRACEHPEDLARLVQRFGSQRIAVGIDARGGKVQTKGWVETTDIDAVTLARQVDAAGVGTIIYTDTARDGMLDGVNAAEMGKICNAVSCTVVASGGVSGVEDIRRLTALRCTNLTGAIVGKALYEGTVNVQQLQTAAL
ncbi:MAG: 1-(5-phosphoribosyl)-5-[(5-phosphoribosylamino)methylideneamino]imidazole-4-carboxamide isomerase [Kiritimatiellaceae bacterium]|nr:1-(5-phosphoribosyl)-5-[(5-phosphoribosylamino)methylideneamino]imidazole-4-carboxamide isomerase [Kiritimatiellaceae bacterium]